MTAPYNVTTMSRNISRLVVALPLHEPPRSQTSDLSQLLLHSIDQRPEFVVGQQEHLQRPDPGLHERQQFGGAGLLGTHRPRFSKPASQGDSEPDAVALSAA